ncbi:efflux RND transporter periplasmic adaptor subunit [Francisella adeliensis]|uniref:Efflux transporter periplasmic adaptor subunit n=1 Tax=Francisella adeliensis TaxID=2007306 RepID=A0A2Z4XYL6_9GAMM|nr:HlyD family secretion protein [Francisella adeliensis]AXA33756.1 efflux transporter periplasmic adaptor subunit [Francisella adeliensis]MBK2085654.1 HlyD family secretion protein [Francisella adeliensis]MBK2097532.1 HlyD family secretion protein [Francisella adeliensis]QIW11991.1 HlyD family secretion protein [Francisella adeliensis]QIW13866.1 HlyD family secretion protein [Francisella adeliensis]
MLERKKIITSLIISILFLACIYSIWNYYMYSPWTRDGRVRANIIMIAPDVSGLVNSVDVVDNQVVKKGDLIFKIDDVRYKAQLLKSQAELEHAYSSWQLSKQQYDRRKLLGKTEAISKEELNNHKIEERIKFAEFKEAQATLAITKTNYERTNVYAPVSGTINNINLRVGSYVSQAIPVISIIEENSFYITGYFEETKLSNIKVGLKAKLELMSGRKPLYGKVAGIGRGVADTNTNTNNQLLPEIKEVYDWVRLPKRIPVDILLTKIPDDTTLVSGMNVTVKII